MGTDMEGLLQARKRSYRRSASLSGADPQVLLEQPLYTRRCPSIVDKTLGARNERLAQDRPVEPGNRNHGLRLSCFASANAKTALWIALSVSWSDTTTQTIETIWPLSIAHGRANTDQNLIGLRTFVQEVLRRSKTSYSTLLVAIYYLVVVMSGLPKDDFTMEQKIDSDGFRAMQCGRRMFLAALILASKYLQDRNYSTRAWSKISGLKVSEINTNERAFLAAVNWKLHMPEPLFQRWERIVLKYSPSGHTPSVPRSSPTACQTWRSIVRQLNADLDQFDNRGMLLSDNDSGYYSESSAPSSRGSSPHAPRNSAETPIPENTTSIPPSLPDLPPLTLEPTPQESKSDHRMLPPLQPREGLLPTPQITPQVRNFCTPAVSASGLLPRRPSMGLAMAEHRKCWEESLLDCATSWQSRSDSIPHRPFTHIPSSLSNRSSSPDSTSDMSGYPSRSSSISSVASSNCALPEPCLAVGVMRRCANMKMSTLPDSLQASGNMAFPRPPVSPASRGSDFYFKERPKRSEAENRPTPHTTYRPSGRRMLSNADAIRWSSETECTTTAVESSQRATTTSRTSSTDDDGATPRPRHTTAEATPSPCSQTYQAAAALVDLTLDRSTAPHQIPTPTTADSRKRGRPQSMDLGLQSSVRDLVRPPSSEGARHDDGDRAIVIPDDEAVADSWLLKDGDGRRNDELWACIDRQNESTPIIREQIMSTLLANTSSESLPRKKTCCAPLRSHEPDPSPLQNLDPSHKDNQTQHQAKQSARKRSGSTRKSNGQLSKRGSQRKPAAEMGYLVRNGREEYVEMETQGVGEMKQRLLYGEVGLW
ncbi:MAG: hypothetical protein HETSPECPRED_000967 [Heterodermia speciosa]|uniref:Cyclin N-terminal domain-containing protein n=1 Tax=Heterodermia speciosa TaxID=116794 RepID=A0A8H3EVL3_9LECA|nr:MAG: hypothetical protein HETSPECPRED_000967 [Heterodermia speciosa]